MYTHPDQEMARPWPPEPTEYEDDLPDVYDQDIPWVDDAGEEREVVMNVLAKVLCGILLLYIAVALILALICAAPILVPLLVADWLSHLGD